jgi:hypothetical protein
VTPELHWNDAKAQAKTWYVNRKVVKSPVAFVFPAARSMAEGGGNIAKEGLCHVSR